MSQMVITDEAAGTRQRPDATRRTRVGLACGVVVVVLAVLGVAVTWAYRTVPLRNNDDPQVDALVVLGTPTDENGRLTDEQRWRVDEAVREYRRGRAPNILITGGPTLKGFVEARAMAGYARAQGMPAAALVEEDSAMTTVQNVSASARILDAHGWRRVEVISSVEHLPRAALILQREDTDLLWQMHAAPTPGRGRLQAVPMYAEEAVGTAAIRAFGLRAEPVLHGIAVVQHAIGFGLRWVVYKAEGKVPH